MTPRLDIDAMRALCAIADFGGVTRASETLSLSQSAVSHKIKRLEAGIDCTLLTRRPGAPLFTEDGQRLVAYARRILALHDEAMLSLSKRPLAGRIRLGMTEDTTSSDLSRILGRFVRLNPGVFVRTHVRQSLELEDDLLRGEIDLAVMQIFTQDLRRTDVALYEDRLHWVKARDLALDPDRPLPFLAYDARCFYKNWAMGSEIASTQGLETVLECASSAGIASAVHAGLGLALLPAAYLTPEMEVIDDRLGAPPRVTFVVRLGQKSRSSSVRALADEIARESQQLARLRAA